MKTLLNALVVVLALFTASSLHAAAPNSQAVEIKVLEGRVDRFLEPGLFWLLSNDGKKTLIYSDGESTKRLRGGQQVRITGTEPSDWARLVEFELSAQSITLVNL